MSHYLITIRSSADTMGIYEGADVWEAVEAMSRDAGYPSLEAEAVSMGLSVDVLRADLSVELVSVADLAARIADAMVAMDRESGDCTPEILADPEAGDASGWDARGMADAAEDAAGAAGRAVAVQYRERILSAYRRAWRDAVEAADDAAVQS